MGIGEMAFDIFVIVTVFGLLTWLNIWYHIERSKMTLEEREKADEEHRLDRMIW